MKLIKTRIPFFPIWPARVDLDGVVVPLKDLPLDARTRRRLMRGSYEPSERDLAKQFVRPGDHVLELGASVGIVSCFVKRQIGPSGRLICVEADPRLAEPFRRQCEANDVNAEWINALGCPIWSDTVPQSIAKQSFVASDRTLSGRAEENPGDGNGPAWLTALAICRQAQLTPTVLIVDIEGTETVWAEHPAHFPVSIRTIIAEFHPRLTGSRAAGLAVQAVIDQGFAIAGMHQTVLAFERK